jgi:hypothetical protein
MMDGVLSRTQKYVTFFFAKSEKRILSRVIIDDIPRLLK